MTNIVLEYLRRKRALHPLSNFQISCSFNYQQFGLLVDLGIHADLVDDCRVA